MASIAAEARTLKLSLEVQHEGQLEVSACGNLALCDRRSTLHYAQLSALVVVWWVAAVGVTSVIRMTVHPTDALGKALYPYSFALTSLTNGFCGILAWVWTSFAPSHPSPKMRRDEVLKLALIGIIQGLEIGCNNKVLEYLSMSHRTMLNSMSVLGMMSTALCWRLERLGALRVVSVVFLTLGGVCQGLGLENANQANSHERAIAHLKGVLLMLFGMGIGCQRWALLQCVMQRSDRNSALAQISKLKLMASVMPITGVVCLVLALVTEADAAKIEHFLQPKLVFNVLMISTGVLSLVFAELKLVELTSAVAVNVLATIHQIPIVMTGVVAFHEHVSNFSLLGFASCLCGALFYVLARRRDVAMAESEHIGAEERIHNEDEEEIAQSPRFYRSLT